MVCELFFGVLSFIRIKIYFKILLIIRRYSKGFFQFYNLSFDCVEFINICLNFKFLNIYYLENIIFFIFVFIQVCILQFNCKVFYVMVFCFFFDRFYYYLLYLILGVKISFIGRLFIVNQEGILWKYDRWKKYIVLGGLIFNI